MLRRGGGFSHRRAARRGGDGGGARHGGRGTRGSTVRCQCAGLQVALPDATEKRAAQELPVLVETQKVRGAANNILDGQRKETICCR